MLSERKPLELSRFPKIIGHASIVKTRETAKNMGINLTSKLNACNDCILAKIRRKNLNKHSSLQSKISGEKLMPDICYVKRKKLREENYVDLNYKSIHLHEILEEG